MLLIFIYIIQSTISQKLLRVLNFMKEENLSLPVFLEELFQSDDQHVAQWAGQFHENNGAGRILKVWDSMLQGGKWEENFINSAVDIVVKRTLKHLESSDVRKDWRLPYKKVTEQKVTELLTNDFRFLHRYAEGAKYLTRFLKGLLKEDISGQEFPPGSRKGYRSRKPSSVRGCIAAILIFILSQKINVFQIVIGFFLHYTGCPKRILEVFSGLGLSVSYSQLQKGLRSLTKDAQRRIKDAVTKHD